MIMRTPTQAVPPFRDAQLHTLEAVCQALAPPVDEPPAIGQATTPSLTPLAAEFASFLAKALSPDELRQIGRALSLLDSRLVNGCLTGQFRRLTALDRAGRERVLRAWARSRLAPLRAGFQVFKRLALFLCYTRLDPHTGHNPHWADIGYPGPVAPGQGAAPLPVLSVAEDVTLEADVAVIGSGAGGGVVAAELAAAGHRVVVLEKGGYFHEADFDGAERASTERLFEKRGLSTTRDAGVVLLAGSNLGGGTTVNWMTCLRTPEYVLRQWQEEHGIAGAAGPEWQASLDAVCRRLNVNTAESVPNPQNQRLIDGCRALGYHWRVLPRNARGCRDCGHCCFGCRFGAKQGILKTYLHDAAEGGAVLVAGAHVERVTVRGGSATGVEATAASRCVTVRSRAVVAAGGSIQTPALLLRSGLGNPNVGRHLHLHPVAAVFGIYPERIEGWHGVMQSVGCDQFADLGGGYGFVIEVPPLHPGLAALGLPWRDAAGHQWLMRQLAHVAVFIAITRDRDGGRVWIDRGGRPVVDYTVSRHDARHVIRAAQEAARLHAAAGAHTVGGPYNNLAETAVAGGAVEARVRGFAGRGVRKNDLTLFSAHQMSSCRMGRSPRQAAVTPDGETYEVRNLFVADASALPTATGVNPMISIMALAHRNAQVIKSRL
jgi:choline dehydrogenase-like flavoprotein